MKLGRAAYFNVAKAGLSVAAVMLVVILIAFRLPGLPEFLRQILGLLLFLPGGLIFMPLIHNIHRSWPGFVFSGVGVNWILYTWGTWALMEKRRRKRELRRTKISADVAPPDRLPPDQSAK
jgi:hypothetical protein